MTNKKVIFFGAIVLFFSFLSVAPSAKAAVFATSTPLVAPHYYFHNKVKENLSFAALEIELSATDGETLSSTTVTLATTTNAVPTPLTQSSFRWIGLFKDNGNCNFDGEDILLATTTANIGTPTIIDVASATTTPAQGIFFVVLKTAATTTFTDNGYPDNSGAVAQQFTVSIAPDGVVASSTSPTINATTTQPFTADTHSQIPSVSSLQATYQAGTYYLQEISGKTLGEEGTTTVYLTQATTTPLATAHLYVEGHLSGPIPLGSCYLSSVWLDLTDALGHSTSSRVQFNLPSQPTITSIRAFPDRIIFQTNKQLSGDQAMDCSNYELNGSVLNCSGPGYPFIDFFGNRVVIRGLNLTLGSQVSLSISGIQDAQEDRFPFTYSTTTLTVEEAAIPSISSISPNATTTGAQVIITGSNFGSATGTLLFSGGFNPSTGPLPPVEATTTAWSSSSITATVPSGAKSGPLQIITSEGMMSDVTDNSFFDVLGNVYIKLVDSTSTNPLTASTNMRIFVGSPNGENVYYDGDSHGTTFNSPVYTIPNISSKGFTWAFDASGNYLSSPGSGLLANTSSTSPQVLVLQGTTTRKVSGTITLGQSCTLEGKDKLVAVMALPEGTEVKMGPGGPQPSFFTTGAGCTTTYSLALPSDTATSTFRIEAHLPPGTSSALLMDPPGQLVTVSAANPTATANFTFTQADRRIYGRIVGADGNPLSPQKYQELWVFAYQPKANGKSSGTRANSNGYFSLYVAEGAYKVGVGGPMMPFPIEKEINVDSSSKFNLNTTTTSITLKLSPPTTYIEGYVRDGAGNGVSDVDIYSWCEGGPGGGHAFTDSQGYYKMYLSPCNNYHIGGFSKSYGNLAEQSGIIVSQSNSPTVNFSLSSTDFITLSGQVTKNGSPLGNVDVWVTQGRSGDGLGWSRSDSTGFYSMRLRKGLSGLYLHAASPGKGEIYFSQLAGGGALDVSTTENISVHTAIIEVHLKPGNTFNNVFLAANSAIGHGSTDIRVSTSTSYDVYKIEVPFELSGTQYIIDGGIPAFGSIPATSTDITASTTIDIDLSGISFHTVSGTVTANVGTSTDAFVWAGGLQGGGGTKVASDGTFSMKLREGTYDIGVGKSGYTGSILKGKSITADTSGLNLSLTKNTASISGVVKYGNTLISNAKVWADNGSGGWSGTVSEADGSFTLNVSAGDWKVNAVAEGYRLAAPLMVTAPANNLTLSLSKVDFSPERKQQSIKPVEGGIIQTSDTKVEVPAGALGSGSTDTAIKIQNTMEVPEAKGAKIFSSKAREITATYSTGGDEGRSISVLDKSVTIELTLTKSELVSAGVSSIAQAQKINLAYYDGTASNWVELPTTVVLNPIDANWSNLVSITLRAVSQHFSEIAPESPSLGAPPAPTDLTATAGDSQVSLSWTASNGATKYDVYRWDGVHYAYLTQIVNTSYIDTGLTNGTTYSYKVSALNDSDQESAATAAVSATPQSSGGGVVVAAAASDTTPPSISGIVVTTFATSTNIAWKTSELSLTHLTYGATTDYGKEVKVNFYVTSHLVALKNLLPGTTYHYQVISEDTSGNVGTSTDKVFTTLSLTGVPEKAANKEREKIPVVTFEKPISAMNIEEIKKKMAEITKAIQLIRALLNRRGVAAGIKSVPVGFTFRRNLRVGMSGIDVKYLQIVLNSNKDTKLALSGVGSPGKETEYFGPLTKKAVIKFQQKYATEVLSPWGLQKGTGFVGKTTRKELNALLSTLSLQ